MSRPSVALALAAVPTEGIRAGRGEVLERAVRYLEDVTVKN